MECLQDESENNKDLPAVCLHKNTVPVKKRKICIQECSFPKRQCRKEEDWTCYGSWMLCPFPSDILKSKGNKKMERKIRFIPSGFKPAQTILTRHIASSLVGFDSAAGVLYCLPHTVAFSLLLTHDYYAQ